jgi:hypothetical protein
LANRDPGTTRTTYRGSAPTARRGERRDDRDAGQQRRNRNDGPYFACGSVGADVSKAAQLATGCGRSTSLASAPADARDPCRSHQPSNPLPASREAIGLQFGVNTRRAVGSMRSSVDRADMARQIGVGGRPSGCWSAPPGVVARSRTFRTSAPECSSHSSASHSLPSACQRSNRRAYEPREAANLAIHNSCAPHAGRLAFRLKGRCHGARRSSVMIRDGTTEEKERQRDD